MASFTCPRCDGYGYEEVIVIRGEEVEKEKRDCSQCRGTGIVDNYGNSKSF